MWVIHGLHPENRTQSQGPTELACPSPPRVPVKGTRLKSTTPEKAGRAADMGSTVAVEAMLLEPGGTVGPGVLVPNWQLESKLLLETREKGGLVCKMQSPTKPPGVVELLVPVGRNA